MKSIRKQEYYFINILKACAALLIINSHYDVIYPISAFATGGAIGNALFFAISGFCLYPVTKKFKNWIYGKILKIYIPTLLMSAIALCTYLKGEYSLESFGFIVIWPTLFWFVGAIALFYLLYYILKDICSNWAFFTLNIILIVSYFVYYVFLLDTSSWVIETNGLNSVEGYFKLIYYFASMMMGKWLHINIKKINCKSKFYLGGMLLSFISLYGVKILITKNIEFMYLQFLNQISVLLFVYFTFCLFITLESKIREYRNTKLYKMAKYISYITLDLYLVQFMVIAYISKLLFPLNLILATILIFIFAGSLNHISTYLYKKITSLGRKGDT